MFKWAGMTRLILTLCLLLAFAPAAAEAKGKSCHVRGASVIAHNRQAMVMARNVEYDDLNSGEELYGCIRSKRRPVLITATDNNQYGSTYLGPIVLTGTMVAYAESRGLIDDSCTSQVTVFSLLGRREKRASSGSEGAVGHCTAVQQLAVSRRGFTAWIETQTDFPARVFRLDTRGERKLDEGDVNRGALTLAENADGTATATWFNAGVARTTVLR